MIVSRMTLTVGLLTVVARTPGAADYYVGPDGKDSNPGTRSRPIATLEPLAGRLVAGDRVLLLGGTYTRPLKVRGWQGTATEPIVLAAAPGEPVVLDGTDLLPDRWQEVDPDSREGRSIQADQWKRLKGRLYCQTISTPINALIYDGRLMSDARWPNARWDDPWRLDRYMVLRRASEESRLGRLHDGLPTENALEESQRWLIYDRSQLHHRDEMLGDTGLSFDGSVVVLSHAWGSWASRITAHDAGSDEFEYDTTFTGSRGIQSEAVGFLNHRLDWSKARQQFKRSSHGGLHFFFVGLPALDIEEEWWYDAPTRRLYFIAPDGRRPLAGRTRGKRRDYLLTASECRYLHIRGLRFLGAAALLEDCSKSRIEDCRFRFSSYHKFSVGNFDMPVTTRIVNNRAQVGAKQTFGNALVNCRFTYLDGNAFEGRSAGLTIDNLLIYRTQQTTLGLDSRSMSINDPRLVRRVTIEDVGASVGIKGGGMDSIYELNNISRFGGLQYDGASLQMGGRDKIIYRYNWSHDHPKRSYRFDAGSYPSFSNAFGEMSYNVAWNTPGGFAVKGDDHLLHNNVLIGEGNLELFNMKRWGGRNERTVVANNIAPGLSAGTDDWNDPIVRKSTQPKSGQPVERPAAQAAAQEPSAKLKRRGHGASKARRLSEVLAVQKNNYFGAPTAVLRDPANLDFRPKRNSPLIDGGYRLRQRDVPWKNIPFTGDDQVQGVAPDIGAYEFGADQYWIPGFQFAEASTPIPPDGTKTAKKDCDLMWLGGYRADRHEVYFGTSSERVTQATRRSPEYTSTFSDSSNIYHPTGLETGKTYFWRVDAIRGQLVTKGRTWSLTVAQDSSR